MSVVDKRIVEMQFDNKQFESGIQTSLKSLDNLNKGIDSTGKGNALAGLTSGVETIASKFSTLGIIGVTALVNITNAAMDAGTQMLKSLTLEPVMDGFAEYELKMGSIQTILANTARHGTVLEDVSKALDELNTYADKTIYNFAGMTEMIGKVTIAGVGLEDATAFVKGFANEAATAGTSAAEMNGALYQTTQALTAGVVKLQDWRSLTNRGMGGKNMQEGLIEMAIAMGVIDKNSTDAKNATENFNASLQSGWLKSEVMMNYMKVMTGDLTDEQVKAMGLSDEMVKKFQKQAKTALEAATKVRTFTQLLGTMKESIGSGWGQTFEIIIGDFEEASNLFTNANNVFDKMIQNASDARNSLLQGWEDLGGRTALINAFKNAFDGVLSVIKPIKEAFHDIFPPTTSQQLFAFTEGLRELTAKLKLSDTTSENLKSTFKGLFALIDLGAQLFSALFSTFTGFAIPAGKGILGFTGAIGDFIVKVNDAAKETNFFKSTIEKLISFVTGIPAAVKNAAAQFAKGFKEVTNIDLGDVKNSISQFVKGFEKITNIDFKLPTLRGFYDLIGKIKDRMPTLGDAFKAATEGISNFFRSFVGFINVEKAGEFVGNVVNGIREAIKIISSLISTGLEGLGFDNLWDFVNGGIFAGILLGIKKFSDSLSDPFTALTSVFKSAKGVTENITGILDSVKNSIEAYQNSIQANTLLKIAGAIAILAAAVTVISLLDPQAVTKSLGAVTVILIQLMGSMAIMQKMMSSNPLKGVGKVTSAMIGMSAAVLILSAAIKILSDLSWEDLVKGLFGIAAATAILIVAVDQISKSAGKMTLAGPGLIAFGAALIIMTGAVALMGAMSWEHLAKGLIGMAAGLLIVAGAVKLIPNNILLIGPGLVILASALVILVGAMALMGALSWEMIGKGIAGIGGALLIIAGAVNLMPNTLPIIAVGLVAISSALVILGAAMLIMAQMSWEKLTVSLVALAGSLAIIVVAMQFMTTALPGAAALLIISAALAILAPVLALLGSMSLGEIGTGLLALVGTFAILGVAGLLLGPVVPVILSLAAALALIGVAAVAFGVGATLLSVAITALAATTVAAATGIVAALSIIVVGIADLIPTVATKLGEGIVAFATAIANGYVAISAAVLVIITAIVNTLVQATPIVVDGVLQLIMSLLQAILQYGPQIIITVVQIIAALLQALGASIPTLINAGIQLMVSFINGMANGIRDNTETVFAAVRNLMSSIIEFALAALAELVRMIPVVGGKMEEELTAAKEKVREVLAPESMEQIGTDGMTAVAEGITASAPVVQEAAATTAESATDGLAKGLMPAFDIGALGGTDFAQGLMDTQGLAKGSGVDLSGNMLQGLSSNQPEYAQLGAQYGQEFSVNLEQNSIDAEQAGKSVTTSAEQGIKSNEPIYKQTGDKYGSDFSTGLDNKKVVANTSAVQLTTSAEEGLKSNSDVFGDTGEKYGEDFSDGIANKAPVAKASGTDVAGKAAEGIESQNDSFISAGENAAQGFIDGILSKTKEAAEASAALARASLRATEKELDEHSPSKKFDKVGSYGGEGFVNGLKRWVTKAADMGSNIGKSAISSITDAVSKVTDVINSDMDAAPTIRPVLDLTEIQNGISSIHRMFGATKGLVVAGTNANAITVANQMRSSAVRETTSLPQQPSPGNHYEFKQYNTSPKALSRLEIYRQTKNQFAIMKGLVEGT